MVMVLAWASMLFSTNSAMAFSGLLCESAMIRIAFQSSPMRSLPLSLLLVFITRGRRMGPCSASYSVGRSAQVSSHRTTGLPSIFHESQAERLHDLFLPARPGGGLRRPSNFTTFDSGSNLDQLAANR